MAKGQSHPKGHARRALLALFTVAVLVVGMFHVFRAEDHQNTGLVSQAQADPCPPDGCGGPTGPSGPSQTNSPSNQGPRTAQPQSPSSPGQVPQGQTAQANPMNGSMQPGNLGSQQSSGGLHAGTNADASGPNPNGTAPTFAANQGPFPNDPPAQQPPAAQQPQSGTYPQSGQQAAQPGQQQGSAQQPQTGTHPQSGQQVSQPGQMQGPDQQQPEDPPNQDQPQQAPNQDQQDQQPQDQQDEDQDQQDQDQQDQDQDQQDQNKSDCKPNKVIGPQTPKANLAPGLYDAFKKLEAAARATGNSGKGVHVEALEKYLNSIGKSLDTKKTVDHVIPLRRLIEIPGFADLPLKMQVAIANSPWNLMESTGSDNSSRKSKLFSEWQGNKQIPADEDQSDTINAGCRAEEQATSQVVPAVQAAAKQVAKQEAEQAAAAAKAATSQAQVPAMPASPPAPAPNTAPGANNLPVYKEPDDGVALADPWTGLGISTVIGVVLLPVELPVEGIVVVGSAAGRGIVAAGKAAGEAIGKAGDAVDKGIEKVLGWGEQAIS